MRTYQAMLADRAVDYITRVFPPSTDPTLSVLSVLSNYI